MIFRRVFALAALVSLAAGKSCVVFDCSWGVYVFGPQANYALGQQSGWGATPLTVFETTVQGRPPFDGENTQCFLSQFNNAMYVLDADASNPNAVHIFNFDSQGWSTLQTNLNGVNPSKLHAILDRDTNVFFALSDSQLYQLDMTALRDADSNTHNWEFVGSPPFAANGAYPAPVLALAQNHIHFLNTGTPGQAEIFVIHFAYFQPEIQEYGAVVSDATSFPSTFGQAVSFFKNEDTVQQKFAFIPEDSRAIYVVDAINNSTQTMAGPLIKAGGSVYAAGQQQLVQLTASGELYWIPFSPDDIGPNFGASWTKIQVAGQPLSGSPSTSTGTRTGTTVATHPATTNTANHNAANRRFGLDLVTTGLGLAFGFTCAWSLL